MRHFWMVLFALLLAFTIGSSTTVHAQSSPVNSGKSTHQLTDKQKKELAGLHKQILQKKKALISKYVEYGLMPRKKGDKLISHMDRHYAKMEKNGFVPKRHHKHMKRHCRHSDQPR